MERNDIEAFVTQLLTRFRQELDGENLEQFNRVVDAQAEKIARLTWRDAQECTKWGKDGPVLMPQHARIYYRKDDVEVILVETPPQIRNIRMLGSLSQRNASTEKLEDGSADKVMSFSLSLPYVVFMFVFKDGMFSEVKCCFADRSLKTLEEPVYRPYLSNIDSDLKVCLGTGFDKTTLQKDNLSQQISMILSHFWQSVYTEDWSGNFWKCKSHFAEKDERLGTIARWQEESITNPLFVIDDVPWIKYSDANYGDMIVSAFDHFNAGRKLEKEISEKYTKEFVKSVVDKLKENLAAAQKKTVDEFASKAIDELLAKL